MKTFNTTDHDHRRLKQRLWIIEAIIFICCILISLYSNAQYEWRPVSPLPTGNTINAVSYPTPSRTVAVGNAGTVLLSESGPLNWDRFNDPADFGYNSIVDVDFADANNGYLLLRGGDQVMKTTTGGEGGWAVANGNGAGVSGANNTTVGKEIQVIDANTVVTVNSVRAYRTVDGGDIWTDITPSGLGSSPQFRDIYFLDSNIGYLLTRGSGLFKTTDGGANWTQLTGFTGIQASIVYFENETNGWIVEGTNSTLTNTIHRTTDGGSTWTSQDYSGGNLSANELIFISSNEGKLFDRNNVFTTSDAGVTWTLEETLPMTPLCISYNATEGKFLLGGADGSLGLYEDDSFVFISNSLTNGKTIQDIHFNDLNNGFVATTHDVFRTADAGISWVALCQANINDIEFGTSEVGYLVSSTKSVQKTTNGGLTWSEVTSLDDGSYIPQSMDFIDASNGWVVGSNSSVFKTTNGGSSWNPQTVPIGSLTLYDVFFLDANNGYISGSGGYIFKTTDGGATWTNANFPETHNIFEMHWTDANTGYLATRKVWKTTDGGANWTSEGFLPTGTVSDIQFLDANTGFATFQGGVIYKTTDAGSSWNVFTEGGEISQTLSELYVIDIDNIWAASAKSLFNRSSPNPSTPTAVGVFLPDLDFCPGEEFIASFTANGQFPDEEVTLQLSDAFGSFVSPTIIGTLNEASSYSGNIEAIIPEVITPSTSYRIRAVSASVTGSDNGYDLSVGGPPTPTSFITSTSEVCKGATGIAYEIEPIDGMSYTWAYSGSGSFNIIDQGNPAITMSFFNSATSGTLSVILSNGCGDSDPLELEITVGTPNVGGISEGGTTVCADTQAPELSVSGHIGEVIRWEQAVSPFSTYTPISNSNSATFTPPGTVTETTRFRAVVQDTGCGEAFASHTTVNVAQPSVGGNVIALSGNTEISSGTSPGNLSLSGHLGNVIRWESSTAPFTDYSPLSSTSTLYNPGPLTEDTRFRAVVKNSTCTEATSDFLEITVLDEEPPQVISFSPGDEDEEQAINTMLEIVFDENIQSTGESSVVNVLRQSDDMLLATVQLNNPLVSVFDQNTLTMTLSNDLPFDVQVYVIIPDNGIEDSEGNRFAGFTDNETWDFTTALEPDNTNPAISSLSPSNGASEVPINADLIIEFDEDISLDNDAGTFELRRKSPDQLVEAFDIFGPRITGGNNSSTITIDPSNDLEHEVEYYFLIGNDVIIDNSDNAFAGLLTANEWSFTTEAAPDTQAPEMVSLDPMDNSEGVSLNADLTITFDEPISGSIDGGFVRVKKASNDAQILGGRPAFEEDQFSIDENTLTIHLSEYTNEAPEYDTEYYITIQNNAIEDQAGNQFPGFDDAFTWSFTTEKAPDLTAPSIESLSPSDDAGNVAIDASLTISFDEDIMIATSGATKQAVIKYGSNQLFEVINLTNDNIDNNILSIPHTDFEKGTTYYLYLANGVIADLSNNWFSGVIEDNEWNFTTESKLDQEITFEPVANKTFGDDPFQMTASSNSGLDVSFSIVEGPITLNGNSVTITGAGNATIAANQAGDDTFNPAQEVTQSFEIAKADQVITITPINDKLTTDAAFDINAEVDSDLELTYNVSGPATNEGATVTLTSETGTVVVTVSQAGNDNYNGASASESFDVTDPAKQDQTINFSEIADKVFGDDSFQLSASSSSDLDVSFSVIEGPISLDGNTVTITGAGTATIAANQSGDDTFNPAQEVTQSFEIAKADQVITITPINDKLTTDAAFDIVAEVDSDLELTYSVSGPATNEAATVTLTGETGAVIITVAQAGNDNYNSASASESFDVTDPAKQDQAITFSEIADKVFGDDSFQLSASSSSDLDVSFSVIEGPISLDGNTVSITGAGTATIAANQAGDDTFNPALEVTQTFQIAKADQIITITPIADKLTTDDEFDIAAEVDSGLELTYNVSGPATNVDATVTLTGESGTVIVTVSQAGNDNYTSTSATESFEVTENALGFENDIELEYYPNPVIDKLTIKTSENSTIRLIGMNGRVLMVKQKIRYGSLDFSTIRPGLYVLEIKSGKHVFREQIIKAN